VDQRELDPKVPWLVQSHVEARADVTVVFVRGALFPFELQRNFTDRSIDWRAVSLDPGFPRWSRHDLPAPVADSIRQYMARLSLDYGRLDFLCRHDGGYAFLEVNPHGEWGWLDPRGEHGLLEAIIREISPLTPVSPIPVKPEFAVRP
jgi:hypothetical protein